jgi:DNA-binding TFAR19-related protein (PDSD5 family)
MISMSDKELELLKRKRLQELQKKMATPELKREQVDTHKVLDSIFIGRAWEVFNAAKAQFPSSMHEIEHLLVNLALEGKIGAMEGEQLYALLRKIGLRVSLNTSIKVIAHGETKSLTDKFRESIK